MKNIMGIHKQTSYAKLYEVFPMCSITVRYIVNRLLL